MISVTRCRDLGCACSVVCVRSVCVYVTSYRVWVCVARCGGGTVGVMATGLKNLWQIVIVQVVARTFVIYKFGIHSSFLDINTRVGAWGVYDKV